MTGVDPGLVNGLEGIGTGLDVSGPWSGGGPFVWIRARTRERLVGWIRGVPSSDFGRSGAWEAWGARMPADSDPVAWPWAVKTIQVFESAEQIEAFARAIEKRSRVARIEAPLHKLMSLLTEAHAADAAGTRRRPFLVPLEDPAELDLLPWIWLLGPEKPANATLGPPRHDRAATDPSLTYEGALDELFDGEAISPYIEDVVNALVAGRADHALEKVDALRQTHPDARKRMLFPPQETHRKSQPPLEPYPTGAANRARGIPRGSTTASDLPHPRRGHAKSRLRLSPTNLLLATLALSTGTFLISLLSFVMSVTQVRSSDESKTPPGNVATPPATSSHATTTTGTIDTSSSEGETSTTAAATDVWPSILTAMRQHATNTPEEFAPAFRTALRAVDITRRGDRVRLRIAAWQLYARRKHRSCYTDTVNGQFGARTETAFSCVANDSRFDALLDDDAQIEEWLTSPGG